MSRYFHVCVFLLLSFCSMGHVDGGRGQSKWFRYALSIMMPWLFVQITSDTILFHWVISLNDLEKPLFAFCIILLCLIILLGRLSLLWCLCFLIIITACPYFMYITIPVYLSARACRSNVCALWVNGGLDNSLSELNLSGVLDCGKTHVVVHFPDMGWGGNTIRLEDKRVEPRSPCQEIQYI